MNHLNTLIQSISSVVNGWPLIVFIACVSIITSFLIGGLQFKAFLQAIKLILFPCKTDVLQSYKDMSPLQAFINTLSTNLGNGSIAGTATALAIGGPGAAVWIIVFGFLTMSIRFVEVYISALYAIKHKNSVLGGPMLYLKDIPGGTFLPLIYTVLCFLFALVGGNAIQANSISIGLQATTGLSGMIIAGALFSFVLYVMCGGARRIVAVSDYLVPVKVILFFGSAFCVLLYHYSMIVPSLILMIRAAFDLNALGGALVGVTLQKAVQLGMQRSIFATESGLGTAAILFGSTESKNPFESGLLGMMSTFVSSVVCFLVALCIVVSGAWSSGLTSTALTIAAYQTVFGFYAGLIVNLLALLFGLGVIISYGYVVRAAWIFLTNNRYQYICVILYGLAACFGSLGAVEFVWMITDIIMAGMLVINVYAVLVFSWRYGSVIRKTLSLR